MARKVIITCAVTGSADTVAKNPAVPVSPAEIAHSALDAARAGAAIVHVHVRDPDSGKASMELDHYRETAGRIRQSETDVVLNLTHGLRRPPQPRRRRPLRLRARHDLHGAGASNRPRG